LSFIISAISSSLSAPYFFTAMYALQQNPQTQMKAIMCMRDQLWPQGGCTITASRQASRHETKDAVLLHSWFRLKSTHWSSMCLCLITSSLFICSSLMSIMYTGAVPWVLMSESWRTEKEPAESCCMCLQHDADVSIMTQNGVQRFS
jgi:hypothetical protein